MAFQPSERDFGVTGTEKEFFSALVTFLTELDNSIRCLSDLDVEFDANDLDHVPEIKFSINNQLNFSFRRGTTSGDIALGTPTSKYVGKCAGASQNIDFNSNGALAYNASARRHFLIHAISGINFVYFLINTTARNLYNQYDNSNLTVACAYTDDDAYYNVSTTINRSTIATVYNLSDRLFTQRSVSVSGNFISRFTYVSPPGKVDYIKSTVCGQNSSKYFDIPGIYDCTTVTVGQTVSISDGLCYAIGPHQIVQYTKTQ